MLNTVPLIALAYGWSGDKGDMVNIGIICCDPKHFEYLKQYLTSQVKIMILILYYFYAIFISQMIFIKWIIMIVFDYLAI